MNSTTFPQSTESSKLSGPSSSSPSSPSSPSSLGSPGSPGSPGGKTSGMGIDTVGDSGNRPMTSSSADMGTSAQSQASAEAAKSRITSIAHDTVDKVADLAGRYATSPTKAVEASKTLMRDKPMVALGAAMALGLLLGRLTSR